MAITISESKDSTAYTQLSQICTDQKLSAPTVGQTVTLSIGGQSVDIDVIA